MYADDTQLTFAAKTVSNIDSNLNEDLSRVNNWLTANKMPVTLALRVMLGLIHLFQLYASPIDKTILPNGIV